MTLEEAIAHCEEVVEENKSQSKWLIYKIQNTEYNEYYKKKYQSCVECAKEHSQLAKWLRELKAYRKAEKEIEQELVNWDDIDNGKCRGLFLATSIIQHYKDEEVDADE